MLVYGVLKESGIWKTDWRIWLDVRKSEFFLAKDKEDAEQMALNMWAGLAKSDQKNTQITVTEKEVTDEDIARIKEEYDVEYEEALELAADECPYEEISVISWASEQEKAKKEEEEEDE